MTFKSKYVILMFTSDTFFVGRYRNSHFHFSCF